MNINAWVYDAGLAGLEAGEGLGENALCEVAVDDNGVAAASGPALEPVKGPAVQCLQKAALLGEQLVGEVAVEDDARAGQQQSQQRNSCAELVDEEGGRGEFLQLVGQQGNVHNQVHLAQDGAENREAAPDGRGDDGVAVHFHIEGSLASGSGLSCLAVHERNVADGGVVEAYRRGPRRSSVAGRNAT